MTPPDLEVVALIRHLRGWAEVGPERPEKALAIRAADTLATLRHSLANARQAATDVDEQTQAAHDEGRAAEREAVLTWLRARLDGCAPASPKRDAITDAIGAIERGEHEPKEPSNA